MHCHRAVRHLVLVAVALVVSCDKSTAPRSHCHRAVRHLVLVAVALVVSCDKSTAPRSTVPVASVTVSPAVASVALGQTVQLTATPRDSQGNGLAGRMVAWSTSDASVATVSGSGLVAAVAVGGATITATSEGKSAGAAITVTTPSSGGTPDPTLLPVATTLQAPLTAAYDALNVPAIAAGAGGPVNNEPVAVWLQQSENDGLFAWMRGASGPTVVGYEPATGTLKTYTNTGIDEPRIDRAGRYIGLTMATPAEALYLWDWQADRIVLQTTGDPDIPFIHVASLRDRWYGVDWNLSQPYEYVVFDPVARTQTLLGGPTNSGDEYGNGNWIQHPADLDDQWALFSHYEGLAPC